MIDILTTNISEAVMNKNENLIFLTIDVTMIVLMTSILDYRWLIPLLYCLHLKRRKC